MNNLINVVTGVCCNFQEEMGQYADNDPAALEAMSKDCF